MNLVVNGEFEASRTNPLRWTATDVEGWESTEGKIEIWNESFLWDGRLGSDGQPTGQHAEISWKTDTASIWTSFTIPDWFDGSEGLFRFNYQNRSARGLWARVLLPESAPQEFYVSSRNSWSLLDASIEGLSAGDAVKLMFTSDGGRSRGAHIDQVEFFIDATKDLRLQSQIADVPLPGSATLFALGAVVLGWRRTVRKV